MQHFGVLTLSLLALASSVDAYAFCSSVSVGAPSRMALRPFTCLRAESEKEAESDAGSDIYSSPVFLNKKLEVLKSDLAKVDEKMVIEMARLEEGKAEWGQQLDDLKKEVSYVRVIVPLSELDGLLLDVDISFHLTFFFPLQYQNIQDRMSSQSKKGDSLATLQVVRNMLKFLDNSDRAFGSVTAETEEEKAIEAEYKETYQTILKTFEKFGVEPVETVGIEFDYEVHQAVMQRPSEDHEEGIVCEELQKGFKLGDVLVRAAMVAVAA
jgi:molecular chaperone GrpE